VAIGIGAHTIKGGFIGSGNAVTNAVTTNASGSSFLAYYISKQFGAGTLIDSFSNSYTRIINDFPVNSTFVMINAWLCSGGTGGASHTATFTPANYPGYACGFLEIVGALPSPLDQNVSPSTGSATTITSPNLTTTAAVELLISLVGTVGNPTFSGPTNGFSILDQVIDGSSGSAICVATNVVSTIGTYSTAVTENSANVNANAFLSFFQAGAGPPSGILLGQALT
jgi:hypothetical protein